MLIDKISLLEKECDNTGYPRAKMKLGSCLTSYTKINSKLIKYLNRRPGTIKLLEENVGGMFRDIQLVNDFLDMTPEVQTIKAKLDKWDYIKLTEELLYRTGKNQE